MAKEADFFSIGTNDLTQYILAADRGNQKLTKLYSPFHPAVLRAVAKVIAAGHKEGKEVGMCGEFAADARAVPLLLGMGLDEFSMASNEIAAVRYQVRGLAAKQAAELARRLWRQERKKRSGGYWNAEIEMLKSKWKISGKTQWTHLQKRLKRCVHSVSTLSISPQKWTPCGQLLNFGIFSPSFKESPVA